MYPNHVSFTKSSPVIVLKDNNPSNGGKEKPRKEPKTFIISNQELIQLNSGNRHIFYTILRIWGSTESFLKCSDFEYSEVLSSFLEVP